MSRKKKPRRRPEKVNLDVLEQIRPHAAGIDIGATEIYVYVGPQPSGPRLRQFGTFTSQLHALADWLAACGVTTVAMESTGVYWTALYDILEARGLAVFLVNARHLKNVSGRKSDVSDCQWLYQLHTYGLLRASYQPPETVRALRALARQREMLVTYRAAHIQHMQQALDLMNLKLTTVLSDITGQTGLKIIRAILAGERDPHVLAGYRHGRCQHSASDIAAALTGHYQPEYLFNLQQALDLYDMYGQQIVAVDAELERLYAAQPPADQGDSPTTTPPAPRRQKRRKNQAHFDLATALYRHAGVDLTQIDGIEALTAQTLLTEIGPDVSAWPTVKHFTAWLGLAPQNDITGGKVKRRRTPQNKQRAATALRVAAQSLTRSQCALGAFYRRIRARKGAPTAIVATARKLACHVYRMLKQRTDYIDPGVDAYYQQQEERARRRLERQAAKMGFALQPIASTNHENAFVS